MKNRSLSFLFGLIVGLAVAGARPLVTLGIAAAFPQTATAPTQAAPPRVKEDPAFKAEWEKLKNSEPKGFEKQRDQFTVMAQMDLAEFGYGTPFTGDLDAGTKQALRAYQTL